MPFKAYKALTFPKKDIIQTKLEIRTANGPKNKTMVLFTAGILMRVADGANIKTVEKVHVVKRVKDFYLSCKAMVNFRILRKNFLVSATRKGHASIAAVSSAHTTYNCP